MWSGKSFPRHDDDVTNPEHASGSVNDERDARLDREFWRKTLPWTSKSHDVDPDAPTQPFGMLRTENAHRLKERFGRRIVPNVDPFVSRIAVIIIGFVLVIPIAWTTRRVEAEPSNLVTNAEVIGSTADASGGTTTSGDAASFSQSAPQNALIDGGQIVETTPTVSVAESAKETAPTIVDAPRSASKATSAPTTTAVSYPCGSTYVVQSGDSWSLIADRASISTRLLLATNQAAVTDVLFPEDELCLPPGTSVVVPTTTPKVSTVVTSAPVPTTTEVIPPAPSSSDAEAIIRAVWPDDLEDHAVEIATRESKLQANAHNWCCIGLFQLHWNAHKSWLAHIGVTSRAQLYDAETNARAALALYERSGGWAPWDL